MRFLAVRGLRSSALVAAAGMAMAGLVVAVAPPAQAQPDPLNRFEHQAVAWHDCNTDPNDRDGAALETIGARCADLTVPLDYRNPQGQTLTLAISRRAATDTAHRLGTLIVNLGGSGTSRRAPFVIAHGAPGFITPDPALAARYDLVGIDQRFIGRSTPVNCAWPNNVAAAAGTAATDRAAFDAAVAANRDLAARCAPVAGELAFASTRNTARDMDIVRAALGERTVSFLGYSQGVNVGGTYLQMFGNRLDRVVFDSGVNPQAFGPDVNRVNGPTSRAALSHWADWAAQHDDQYHLGATNTAVLHTIAAIDDTAAKRPLTVGPLRVTEDMLPQIIIRVDDDLDPGNADLATDVATLRGAAEGRPVTPSPFLSAFVNSYSDPTVPAGGHAGAVNANACADRAVSRDPETYWNDIQRHRVSDPFYGPLYRGIGPCAFWPTHPLEQPTVINNDHPVLMAGATGDPDVPYTGQLALHAELHGSRFITVANTFHHAEFLAAGNSCVDTAVDAYLLGGPLPRTDLTCQHA